MHQTKKKPVSDKWMISVCCSCLSETQEASISVKGVLSSVFWGKHTFLSSKKLSEQTSNCTTQPCSGSMTVYLTWSAKFPFAFHFWHVSTTSTLSMPPDCLQPVCQPGQAISVRTSWTLAICQSANATVLFLRAKMQVLLCTCKSIILSRQKVECEVFDRPL